jgi:hypothetical protein
VSRLFFSDGAAYGDARLHNVSPSAQIGASGDGARDRSLKATGREQRLSTMRTSDSPWTFVIVAALLATQITACVNQQGEPIDAVAKAPAASQDNPVGCSAAALPTASVTVSHDYYVLDLHAASPVPDNQAADVRMYADRVELDAIQAETSIIRPEEVSFCSATCFGMDRPYVKLVLGEQAKIVSIKGRELVEWCWSHHKPMLDTKHLDAWEYHGVPLPPVVDYEHQFASRDQYDQAFCRTCSGQ